MTATPPSLNVTFTRPSYSVAEWDEATNTGEAAIRAAIRNGELVARKPSPRRTIITLEDGLRWLQSLEQVDAS